MGEDARVELWRRTEVVSGNESAFEWMVWRADGTLGGDCQWFTDEEEARVAAGVGADDRA